MNGRASRRRTVSFYVLTFASALLLLGWSRTFEAANLTLAAVTLLVAAMLAVHDAVRRTRPLVFPLVALGLLTFGLVSSWVIDRNLGHVSRDWEVQVAEREAELGRELDRRMARLVERAESAASLAAALASRSSPREIFVELERIRNRAAVDALVIHDESGELLSWSGDHRGPIPQEARTGPGIIYAERPLYGYLYVSRPVEGREARALAAVLLEGELPVDGERSTGVAGRFAARMGARPYFGQGAGEGAAWSLVVDGDTVVHARFDPLTQGQRRSEVESTGRRIVVPVVFLALGVLMVGWHRGVTIRWRPVPLLAASVALAIAPLGEVIGARRLFSPGLFLLPVPIEVTLGRLLAVLLPLAALVAAARTPSVDQRRARVWLAGGALLVGVGFSGGLRLFVDGAAPSLLQGGAYLWGALYLTAFLVLTMLGALALPNARQGRIRIAPLVAGVVLTVLLGAVVLARWRYAQRIEPSFLTLWAVPFTLFGVGIMGYAGALHRVIRWLLAGWLAASAVLPHLWVTQVHARLNAAEREIASLGINPDPFLDYLLYQLGAEASRRHTRGEGGLELIYRSWVASGFAREPYPAIFTIWDADGAVETELSVGDVDLRRTSASSELRLEQIVAASRESGSTVQGTAAGIKGGGKVVAIPLDGGKVFTAVVPPRRSLDRATPLASMLGTGPDPTTRFSLVPAATTRLSLPNEIQWLPTATGWRSETLIQYPDGEYHGHFELDQPPLGVMLARAGLLLAAGLGLLIVLWLVGRAARGEPPAPPGGWATWSGTFRARITAALFLFFLLPTILFGFLAFQALAGEAGRTAKAVAERATHQAVSAFNELSGDLVGVATRIGEDVLFYHHGELIAASSPEIVELGLFGAWMPGAVYATLQSGEEMSVVETIRLANRPYLIAYRKLPFGTVAVPVLLASGEAAVRQRELADVILFSILVGGLLSLGLSVAVGRTLAQPIGRLRRAAAAVGSGRLRVRLPEQEAGEFGELFSSFNRMVRRLRRARAQEIRTARVLAWGEMSRQVAHEIKNPLTPIKLSVQHLRRAYADGRPDFAEILELNVEQILAEIDRLTEIARVFARFGAPPEAAGPLERVDVGRVVEETLTLYRAGEGGVRYVTEVEADLPPAHARAGELKEVLLNLLENAHDALENGGEVRVEVRREGEGWLELVVRDDGPGIPPELLDRIFEPHFSTRATGTGLGLGIVRRLVEGWGGAVAAESEPGRGAVIRVRLPVAESASVASGN